MENQINTIAETKKFYVTESAGGNYIVKISKESVGFNLFKSLDCVLRFKTYEKASKTAKRLKKLLPSCYNLKVAFIQQPVVRSSDTTVATKPSFFIRYNQWSYPKNIQFDKNLIEATEIDCIEGVNYISP